VAVDLPIAYPWEPDLGGPRSNRAAGELGAVFGIGPVTAEGEEPVEPGARKLDVRRRLQSPGHYRPLSGAGSDRIGVPSPSITPDGSVEAGMLRA
jgi:hypothetical protein